VRLNRALSAELLWHVAAVVERSWHVCSRSHMASVAGPSSSSQSVDVPPRRLRRQPQRSDIGPNAAYRSEAAFLQDFAAWERERDERAALMKERERDCDRRRDRSERQRDGVDETDNERRARQRRDDPVQAQAHADCERARQAAKRNNPRLEQQQAWATDVATFAGIFATAEPRSHPLAYYGHRCDDWLNEGKQIIALHDFIVANPPSGEDQWEEAVDNFVCELWSRPGSTPHRGCEELWSSETHFGDGYLMLLALPSTPESIAQPQMPPPLAPWKTTSINEQRAKRGFGPLRGW